VLCIYIIEETDNKVYPYSLYFLRELLPFCRKIIVLISEKTPEEDKKSIEELGCQCLRRPDSEIGVESWRYGLDFIDYNNIKKYSSVILCNNSFFGPFSDLNSVFLKMEQERCDFWGITEIKTESLTYLQNYFLCFKRSLTSSSLFRSFCRKVLSGKAGKKEEIEKKITDYFIRAGFSYKSFISYSQVSKAGTPDSTQFSPVDLLKLGAPFVKKELFINDSNKQFLTGTLEYPNAAIDFIRTKTNYPFQLFYKYIVKKVPASRLKTIFLTDFVTSGYISKERKSKSKVALILHVFYPELLGNCKKYVLSMRPEDKVVIVSSSSTLLRSYENELQTKFPNLEIRLQPNRGRNEAAYFLTCKDILENYDVVCLAHDKKLPHLPQVEGEKAFVHCFENCLSSISHVDQVIKLFDSIEYLGLLCPPTPQVAAWRDLSSNPYGLNLKQAKELIRGVNKDFPFDVNPPFPVGSVFWVRKGALNNLLNLTLSDFPEEPLPSDGTFLHALERLYPAFVVMNGYVPGWIFSDKGFKVYTEEVSINLRRLASASLVFKNFGAIGLIKKILKKNLIHYNLIKKYLQ